MVYENTIIQGNCIDILKEIRNKSIDLIYLDPPFYTQRKHKLKTRDNTKTYEFDDSWESIDDYLLMVKNCLIEFRRILKNTGVLFFHCDKKSSHHIQILLDEIFSRENFQSEIIWYYKRWSNSKKGLLNSHQNIYFYSKTKHFKFNTIFTDYSPTTNVDQILQKRVRDKHNKSVYAKDDNGKIIMNGGKKGVPLSDVWEIPFLNPKAKERTGYPTQKPILLLERIIKLITEENDLILDPFCGSGTTMVAAKLLKRNYIGIDISKEAVELTQKRLESLIKTDSILLQKGIDHYKQKPEIELSILKSLNAIPVYRNSGIDGFLKETYEGVPIPIKIQKNNESLESSKNKLIKSAKSKDCKFMILIKTSPDKQLTNENKDNLLILDSYNLNIKKALGI